MLPSDFNYIFFHLRQKAQFKPEKPEILSTFGPNPTRKARHDLQLCYDVFVFDLHRLLRDFIRRTRLAIVLV